MEEADGLVLEWLPKGTVPLKTVVSKGNTKLVIVVKEAKYGMVVQVLLLV